MAVITYLLICLAGLATGWFANIIAQRLPIEDRPLFGPLRCVRSGERLRWFDTFPIFGYLIQRGRCRYCQQSLPLRFPLLEFLIVLCLVVAWPFYSNQSLAAYIFNAFAIALLITIALIDWRLRLIFPIMIYSGVLVAVVAVLVAGSKTADSRIPDNLLSLLLGAGVGAGLFLLIYWLSIAIYHIRALGFGDVLLALLIGAENGFPRVVSALFLGSIIGGIAALIIFASRRKKRRDFIPYGTWMCFGAVLVLVFGNTVWQFGPLQTLAGLFDLMFTIVFEWLNRVLGG